jgi:dTDP-4-amino-4,6-dideoxygalactose transaminase
MHFIDLAAQQGVIRDSLRQRIEKVLAHGQYINGPEVAELEKTLAAFTGTAAAVGCSSGTDALLLALLACGVGPGDAVFTTPFTFIATAEVISLLGAAPVFVDIEPGTFNIDAQALERAVSACLSGDFAKHPLPAGAAKKSLRPRAVIPVDIFGVPADYDAIVPLAGKNGLFVIEDAAQSFGALYRGKRASSLAGVGCTSFFPAKPLGCYGDGGMCFTNDPALSETMRSLRVHGQGRDKYDNVRIGINGRLDTLQAAVLLAKFQVFPGELDLRQEVARRYTQGLAGDGRFTVQNVPGHVVSAWAQYSLLVSDPSMRGPLLAHMKKRGIPTAIYYPKPLHLQEAFSGLGYKKGDFPVSEDVAGRIFSIPMHPYLGREEQKAIIDAIVSWR